MSKFKVTVREVWSYDVEVEANDTDDAKDAVEALEGVQISPSSSEYVLERDSWDVVEI